MRTSIFVNPDPQMIEGAAVVGTDRVELYTENYATAYGSGDEKGILPYIESGKGSAGHPDGA